MQIEPRRLCDWLAWTLFAAVLGVMLWWILTPPFVAYANSYDFLRQSSCVGLWQSIDGVDKTAGNYLFPSRWLHFDADVRPELCMTSVDNLFPWLASLLHQPGTRLSFAWVAAGKLTFLAAGCALLLWRAGAMRLPIALLFTLLFSDWVNLAYINTLYLEFSVLIAAFWLLAGGARLLAMRDKPDVPLLAVLLLAVVWLGASKQQYAPLALVFALFLALLCWLRWRLWQATVAFMLLGLSAVLAFSWLNPADSELMQRIDQANKTNTYLGAVLPAAADKEAALGQLGLPPSCADHIGSDWYRNEGSRPCPEVYQISRLQLPGLFLSQPQTLWQPLYRAALEVRPFHPDYLGLYEPGDEPAGAAKLETVLQGSFSTALAQLPGLAYGLLVTALCVAAFAAAILLLVSGNIGELMRAALSFQVLGGAVAFYALFSSVFGDGFIELEKHAVLFLPGLAAQVLSLLLGLVLLLAGLLEEASARRRQKRA